MPSGSGRPTPSPSPLSSKHLLQTYPRSLSRSGSLPSSLRQRRLLHLRPRLKSLHHLRQSPMSRAPGRPWPSRAQALEQLQNHLQLLEQDNQPQGLESPRREPPSPRAASRTGTSVLVVRAGLHLVLLQPQEVVDHRWRGLRGSRRKKTRGGTGS